MLTFGYQILKQRLSAEVAPSLKYVDWYLGQYLEDEQEDGGELLWDTPAAFIEFFPIEWESRPGNIQTAELNFALHLVNESVYPDDRRVLDPAVNHLTQESSVFTSMQNYRGLLSHLPAYAALAGTDNDRVILESIVRKTSEPDHNMRRQLVSVQQFRCIIYDYSAVPNWIQILASLTINVEKVDQL